MNDMRKNAHDFVERTWWASELVKSLDEPGYKMKDLADDEMMFAVNVAVMVQPFRAQWFATPMTTVEVVYAITRLLSTSEDARKQAKARANDAVDKQLAKCIDDKRKVV